MTFWGWIKSIWKKKKEQPDNRDQVELDEQNISRMRIFLEVKDKTSFVIWLCDQGFSYYERFDSITDPEMRSNFLAKAKALFEIIDQIQSVTEEKIFIAEENLKLLKGK